MGNSESHTEPVLRLPYIDACKGFAILLVVIGHVIQCIYSPRNFDSNIIYRVIYSFHMPLFFFLSGYVSRMEMSFTIYIQLLVKRFLQLMLPFCFWGLYFNRLDYQESIYTFFLKPDHSLWFLFHLFVIIIYCNTILLLSKKITSKIFFTILVFILGYCVLCKLCQYNSNDYGQLRMLTYYYPYYIIGMFWGIYKGVIYDNKNTMIVAFFSIVLFIPLSSLWYRVPEAISLDAPHYISLINSLQTYKYITALMGIIGITTLFSKIYLYSNRMMIMLIKLGKNTLGIYAIHIVLLKTFCPYYISFLGRFAESYAGFLCSTIILLIVTQLFINIIRLSKFISLLLIGNVDNSLMLLKK